MKIEYALGCDEGSIPTVSIDRLSCYWVGEQEYQDFCLTAQAYETLKDHFFSIFKAEENHG